MFAIILVVVAVGYEVGDINNRQGDLMYGLFDNFGQFHVLHLYPNIAFRLKPYIL